MKTIAFSSGGIPGNNSLRARVLFFCLKHPRMKFTLECIGLSPEIDRAQLEREIENLTEQGILSRFVNAHGVIFYYVNRPVQEIAQLVEASS